MAKLGITGFAVISLAYVWLRNSFAPFKCRVAAPKGAPS